MRPVIKSFITSFIAVAVIGCDGVSGQAVPVLGGSIDVNCEVLLAPLQRAIDIATTGAVINVTGMCFEDEVRVPGDKTDLTIQGVPVLQESFGWSLAFPLLALGPIIGINAIRRFDQDARSRSAPRRP